jgi:hypothetical protein
VAAERDDPLPRWLAVAGLAALAAWAFWDRWQFLNGTAYPTGVDGFWYAVQLRSILDGEGLYYPAAPLSLWLMTPLAAASDPVTGAKLGAALAAAALPLTTYPLGRRIGGERAAGLFAAILVATSAGSFYLATEFVKNAVALPIGMGALTTLGWALERPSRGRLALAGLLVAATGLTHGLVLAFVLVAGAAPVAVALVDRGSFRAAGIGAAVALVAVSVLAWRASGLLGGLFAADADWSIPALRLGDRVLLFRHEAAIAGLAGLTAIALVFVKRVGTGAPLRDRSLALGPALWAVFFALPWLDVTDPQGLAFRVRVMAFAPLALAAALALSHAFSRLDRTWRMSALMLCAGLALYRPGRYEAPVVRADPAMAAAVAAARVPAGDMIVCPERHLVFMTVWYTGVETRLDPASVPAARRWRLVPMSYMSENLVRAIDEAREAGRIATGLHRGNPNGLVLMPEATWDWVLGRLEGGERAWYQRWPTH